MCGDQYNSVFRKSQIFSQDRIFVGVMNKYLRENFSRGVGKELQGRGPIEGMEERAY